MSLGLREDTPEETEALIKGRGSLSSILYPRLYAASLRFLFRLRFYCNVQGHVIQGVKKKCSWNSFLLFDFCDNQVFYSVA